MPLFVVPLGVIVSSGVASVIFRCLTTVDLMGVRRIFRLMRAPQRP